MFAGIPAPQFFGVRQSLRNIPSLAVFGAGTCQPEGLFTANTYFRQMALGGAVGAGRPYMVGERGPELFVPGAQGNIVPNNAMGGANVTVNVDASGSSVEGNSDQASQLGKMLGIAVQAELVKQNVLAVSSQADGYFPVNHAEPTASKSAAHQTFARCVF